MKHERPRQRRNSYACNKEELSKLFSKRHFVPSNCVNGNGLIKTVYLSKIYCHTCFLYPILSGGTDVSHLTSRYYYILTVWKYLKIARFHRPLITKKIQNKFN
jgi:hypothetical protein